MVLFDCDSLCFLFCDNPGKIIDPSTRKSVERPKEKIEYLIKVLASKREKIVLPTPALNEILCLAGNDAHEVLAALTNTYGFELAAFDVRAAVEAAIITRNALAKGNKTRGSKSTWAKLKFDRQIIAIAKSRGVSVIYANDADIHRFAKKEELEVISVRDLPDPPLEQSYLDLREGESETSEV